MFVQAAITIERIFSVCSTQKDSVLLHMLRFPISHCWATNESLFKIMKQTPQIDWDVNHNLRPSYTFTLLISSHERRLGQPASYTSKKCMTTDCLPTRNNSL